MTVPLAKVLRVLLDEPRQQHYGLEIMHKTGLPSGSCYPIFRRLEGAAWVESSWEQLDGREPGRPRRRYYTLTGEGVSLARHALAEMHSLSAEGPRLGTLRPLRGGT